MTDLVPARSFALDVLAEAPESVPDALDRQARLDALIRRLEALREIPRRWLADYGAERAKADGAFNVPIKGTGQTYLDQPEGTFRIANRDVCAEWLSALEPEAVEVVYRPNWPDVPAGDDPRKVALAMVEALDRPAEEIVETVVVLDEDRALALAKANGHYEPETVSSVRYYDPETGAVSTTGIEWTPPRDPRLTVKIDPAYAKALDGELARVLDR